MPHRIAARRSTIGAIAMCLGIGMTLAACTGGGSSGSSGTVVLPPAPTATTTTSAPVTPTPETPDGQATGPGVTDTTISLGLLIDPQRDKGFTSGIELWANSVNEDGGICGRHVDIPAAGIGGDLLTQYDQLARSVLGFISLPDAATSSPLAAASTADRIPVLTEGGSSTDLTEFGPVPLAATDDIETINALSYLQSKGTVSAQKPVGVVHDGSVAARNALAGARWWSQQSDIGLDIRDIGDPAADPDPARWNGVGAVLVLADSSAVAAVLTGTPAGLTVVATLDEYDPAQFPAADDKRLVLSIPTPALGSNHPGAAAVAQAVTRAGIQDPGARLLSGYAVASGWGRVLARACSDQDLTRAGIQDAMSKTGPAPVDSLLGPSDPGLVLKGLPATRVSSLAVADRTAPAGMLPLVWTQAAPGIADYEPGS